MDSGGSFEAASVTPRQRYSQTTFGWPLILGGAIKLLYDVLLLRQFANLRPEQELQAVSLKP